MTPSKGRHTLSSQSFNSLNGRQTSHVLGIYLRFSFHSVDISPGPDLLTHLEVFKYIKILGQSSTEMWEGNVPSP